MYKIWTKKQVYFTYYYLETLHIMTGNEIKFRFAMMLAVPGSSAVLLSEPLGPLLIIPKIALRDMMSITLNNHQISGMKC